MPLTAPAPPDAAEFEAIAKIFYEASGARMGPAKRDLVNGRLSRRIGQVGCDSYAGYIARLREDASGIERQMLVDLLTTNETYFFREAKHFEFLGQLIREGVLGATTRIWSAAGSTGEEAYSIAMVLHDRLGAGPWEVFASDISARVVERARRALYPFERTREMPPYYMRKYCLKGTGQYEGHLLVARELRENVRFSQINLAAPLPGGLGMFDVVFLRNMLIYFEADQKRAIVRRVAETLRPGGWLLVGHSETLNGLDTGLRSDGPSRYRR